MFYVCQLLLTLIIPPILGLSHNFDPSRMLIPCHLSYIRINILDGSKLRDVPLHCQRKEKEKENQKKRNIKLRKIDNR